MLKDAYYFSHDSNAKDDPKCVLLIEQLGLEGYGIYWVLIETLRDQPNFKYPIILIPALARRYNTTAEKMKTVVCNYGLFEVDQENFFSLSLMQRMKYLEYKREIASKAGKISAAKRLLNSGSTDVKPTLNSGSTSKVKESKVKESKVKDNINTPYQEIVNMFHSICVSFKPIRSVTKNRKEHIGARWNDHKQNIATFEELFRKAEASDFLTSRRPNDRNWKPDFDWLMNQQNMAKVLEGKYDNENNPSKPMPRAYARLLDLMQEAEKNEP